MPHIIVAISDLENSVERPVIYDVLRQVMEITQISDKTPIRFMGDEGEAAQTGSTIVKNPMVQNSWAFNDRVTIEVDEDFEKDRLLTTVIKGPEHAAIFNDPDLGIFMRPAYSSSDVSIKVHYKARDKNQANRWRNEIRARTALLRDMNLHEIGYHYHVPETCLVLLHELHRLRENMAGYSESFNEYFTRRLTTNASIVTNLSGQAALWAVSERQIRIQGYFEFEGVPDKPEREGDHDAWSVSFSYRFRYDKPIHCTMGYPIMVHNQLLSEEFRPGEKAYSLQDQLRTFTLSSRAFSEFETDTALLLAKGNAGLDIPPFDEFLPNSIPASTVRVFTALSNISDEDRHHLFYLNDLGDFNLDRDILDFIEQSEYPFMTKTYCSVLCLNLYEGVFLRASGALDVSPELMVSAVGALDLRKTYRSRLSLVSEFAYLSAAALDRLKAFPQAAIKIAKALDAALADCGGYRDIGKNRLTPREYMRIGLDPWGHYTLYNSKSSDTWGGHAIYRDGAPLSGTGRDQLDQLPIGPSRTANPEAPIWGLVQSLFVAARPVALLPHDLNDHTYTKSS